MNITPLNYWPSAVSDHSAFQKDVYFMIEKKLPAIPTIVLQYYLPIYMTEGGNEVVAPQPLLVVLCKYLRYSVIIKAIDFQRKI